MSVQPVDPNTDPLVSQGVVLLQKGLALLGLLGVSVPPLLMNNAVDVQIVSFIVGIAGLAWSAWSHLKTRTQAISARVSAARLSSAAPTVRGSTTSR